MTRKLSGLTAAARAGFVFLGHTVYNRGARDTRHDGDFSRMLWSDDLAHMMEADLTTLDSMAHGFAAKPDRRRHCRT